MNRVLVTNPFVSIIAMQVCAVKDATDAEILEVCNAENPAGTTTGWCNVVRNAKSPTEGAPVQCAEYEDRNLFIVQC